MENAPDCLRCCCSAVRLCLYICLQQMVPFQRNFLLWQEEVPKNDSKVEGDQDRVYLDLTPVKSFLHCAGKKSCQPSPLSSPTLERAANKSAAESTPETALMAKEAEPCSKAMETSEQVLSRAATRGWASSVGHIPLPHHLTLFPPPETPREVRA